MTQDPNGARPRRGSRGLAIGLGAAAACGGGLAVAAYVWPEEPFGVRGALHTEGAWRAFRDTGGVVSLWRADDPVVMVTVVGRAVVTHGATFPRCGRGRYDPATTSRVQLVASDEVAWATVRDALAAVQSTRSAAGCPAPARPPSADLWAAAERAGDEPLPEVVAALRPLVASALAGSSADRTVAFTGRGAAPVLPGRSDPLASRRGVLSQGYGGSHWESGGVRYRVSGGYAERDGVDGLVVGVDSGRAVVSLSPDSGQLARNDEHDVLDRDRLERDVPPPVSARAHIATVDAVAAWLTTGRPPLLGPRRIRLTGESVDVLLTARGVVAAALPRSGGTATATLLPTGTLVVGVPASVNVSGTWVGLRVVTRLPRLRPSRATALAGRVVRRSRARVLRAGEARITISLDGAPPRPAGRRALDLAAGRVILTRTPSRA